MIIIICKQLELQGIIINTNNLYAIIGFKYFGQMSRVFTNGPGDPRRVMPKTQKVVLDAALLNTLNYKV